MPIDRFFYPSGNPFTSVNGFDWQQASQFISVNLLFSVSKAALIIVLAVVVYKIGLSIIHRAFRKQSRLHKTSPARIETLSSLLSSILKYVVYFFTAIFFLQFVFGFNAGATIAAVSVSGVAVGLAAQGIIRDLLTGVFILMENQYTVGEKITIKNMTGVVEDMELRITRLRADDGSIHVIPNGEVGAVTNHSRKREEHAPSD